VTEPHDQSVPAARDPYPTVLEVGTTLVATLDLDEVVQTIARQVGEALDVQWCDINEYDSVARTFTYTAVWSEALRGVDLDYLGTVISLDDRPERDAVIRKGELLETYADDPQLDERERAVMIEYDEKAVMEVPLVFGGEVLGVLGVVESRRDRHFTEEEKELLRLLAGPAATALGNARLYRAQQEQARRLAALLDASRALAASVDIDEVLAGVARVAADVSGAAYSTVYEYRPHHDALVFRASHSRQFTPRYVADDPLGTTYSLADWPGERAILEGTAAVQEHVSDDGVARDRRSSMEAWGQKTCLSLPLRAAGEAQGILRLGTLDEERRFTAEELELLEALAEVASAAIHNARLFRAQGEESERLLELFDVSRRLSSAFDRAAVVEALGDGAGRLLAGGGRRARVWLREEDGRLSAAGEGGEDPCELALQALAGPSVAEVTGPARSGLAVPLVVRDMAEGVVVVEAQGHRTFSLGEREALQVLANQAAAALENERLYRRAEQEAIRDGLTGLYNHRHFQERMLQECRRARRYGMPLSLLMIDLDDFKGFNDQFGHQIGDEALREVGQILFAVTRRGVDIAARYGGEEFAVILPHTPTGLSPKEGAAETGVDPETDSDPEAPPPGAGALVVAERVREAIAQHAFPGHGGRRYARTTATVGVAELHDGDDAAQLIAVADAALYEGKRLGRDRVVVRGD
jgi:GAF domain-containing protein